MEKPHGSLISFFSRKVKKDGGVNLAQGRPGFDPPEELLAILKKNISDMDLHQYAPGNGDPELVANLVKSYEQFCDCSSKNFLVLHGATEAIFLTFYYLTTIIKGSFSTLSFDPVYESYPKLPSFHNTPFHYFNIGEDLKIDFSALENKIKEENVKIIFISSPGNPAGKIWEKEELEKISVLSVKYNFFIIFDAVYKDIYFNSEPFNPLTLGNNNLFYINSFSKMLSITGWRIGYLISTHDHMKKLKSIHDYTGLSVPYLLQRSISGYLLRSGNGEDYIKTVRKKCRKNFYFLKEILENLGFFISPAEGGYFLWARLPKHYQDGFFFAEDLYNKVKLAVVPGENFSPSAKNYIRINIAVKPDIIKKGASLFKEFFSKELS